MRRLAVLACIGFAARSGAEPHVIAVGDSLTAGGAWLHLLTQHGVIASWDDLGIWGESAWDAADGIEAVSSGRFRDFLETLPPVDEPVCAIFFGTNDVRNIAWDGLGSYGDGRRSWTATRAALAQMTDDCLVRGIAVVLVVPPLFHVGSQTELQVQRYNARIEVLRKIVREIAWQRWDTGQWVVIADVAAHWEQLPGWPSLEYYRAGSAGADGVHPGTSGSTSPSGNSGRWHVAEVLAAAIRAARSPTPDDPDLDGAADPADNCPRIPNPSQADRDGDGVGDACNEGDGDGDEWADPLDNCPLLANPDQRDTDGDALGDACNDALDTDGDEWVDLLDRCPHFFDPAQGPCLLIPWEGGVSVSLPRLGEGATPELTGVGFAQIGVAGAAVPGHLQELRFPGRQRGAIHGTQTLARTDPALPAPHFAAVALSQIELATGTLGPISGGLATTGGTSTKPLPLRGLLRLCWIDAACGAGEFRIALTAPTLGGANAAGAGIGGTVTGTAQSFSTATDPVRYTLEAAAWSPGSVTVRDQTGLTGTASPRLAAHVATGFAHGPASATSSTAAPGGVLQVVSPLQIQTSIDPADPRHLARIGAFARLQIRFVPEARPLHALGVAAAALCALARRRRTAARAGESAQRAGVIPGTPSGNPLPPPGSVRDRGPRG